jgi:hypothetical protein
LACQFILKLLPETIPNGGGRIGALILNGGQNAVSATHPAYHPHLRTIERWDMVLLTISLVTMATARYWRF